MAEPTVTFQPEQGRADSAEPLSAGRTLGPYELVVWLGRGGMADVWIAVRHGGFGFRQHFAVKTMRSEFVASSGFRAMFLEEARLASKVHHTNVVPVLDLGEDHGTVYQAMPLVDGDSVASLARKLRESGKEDGMAVEVALRIAIDAARGLHAAHMAKDENGRQLDLVHRDVSPQNILVGLDGVAKVSDFGIAKAFGLATEETSSNDLKGKRAYLAPEQIKRLPVDRRADIFALGVVIWEMLTGRRMFNTGDSAMYLSLVPRLQDVREVRSDVPLGIAQTIARAVEAKVEDRFATAEELADELEKTARENGITPSAKRVGQLVETLVGNDVHGRSRVLSEWTNARSSEITDVASDTAVVDTIVLPTANAGTRRRLLLAVAGLMTTLAVVVALVFLRQSRTLPAAAPAPAAETAPPVVAEAPGRTSSSTSSSASVPAANVSTSAEASAPAPMAAAPTVKATAKTAPRARAAPQPKFSDNPYAH